MLEKVKNKKRGHAASGDSDLIAEEKEEGEESKHQSVEKQPLGNNELLRYFKAENDMNDGGSAL